MGDLAGQFKILRPLFSGDCSVFQAFQLTLGRNVVIKFLNPGLLEEQEAIRSFSSEARLLARLKHQHIVELLDFVPGDRPYMVLEYIDGRSLSEILFSRGPLPLRDVFSILLQVLSGVSFMHQQGVIHGNLKPEHILVDREGWAKVTDLGLARDERSGPPSDRLPPGSTQIGTPAYMAPELFRGRPTSRQTDVYALGVILYQLLVGHPPFHREDWETLRHLHIEVPPPPIRGLSRTIPLELEEIVRVALAKTTGRRYADVDSFRVDIEDLALFAQLWIDDYVPSVSSSEPERFPAWSVTLPVRPLIPSGPSTSDSQVGSKTGPCEPSSNIFDEQPGATASIDQSNDKDPVRTALHSSESSATRLSPRPTAARRGTGPILMPPLQRAQTAHPEVAVVQIPVITPRRRRNPPAMLLSILACLIVAASWKGVVTEPWHPRWVETGRPESLTVTDSRAALRVCWNTPGACQTRAWYQDGHGTLIEISTNRLPSRRHEVFLPRSCASGEGWVRVALGGFSVSSPAPLTAISPLSITSAVAKTDGDGVEVQVATNRESDVAVSLLPGIEGQPRESRSTTPRSRSHRVRLSGLTPGAPQLARIVATDRSNESAWGGLLVRMPTPKVESCLVATGAAGTLLTDGESAVVWTADRLEAVRLANGQRLWSLAGVAGPGPRPIYRMGLVVVASCTGELSAVDWNGGQLRWRVRTDRSVVGALAGTATTVYLVTADGALLAHRLADGALVWRSDVGGPPSTGPLSVDGDGQTGEVMVARSDGRLLFFSSTSGSLVRTLDCAASIDGVAIQGSRLLVSGPTGSMALDRKGRRIWETTERGAMAADGQQVAMASGAEITLMDGHTGIRVWKVPLASRSVATPLLGSKSVYVAGQDGTIRALSRASGREMWIHQGAHPARELFLAGPAVWIVDEVGHVTRIRES